MTSSSASAPDAVSSASFEARLSQAATAAEKLRQSIGTVVVGQSMAVDQVLWGMMAGGHVLLEGAPGLGKTLLVKTLSQCLALSFSRIQFTPDLMPSDVLGTNILVSGEGGHKSFRLHRGPIFGQVVLADEINRATPKTQSALLEAMQEHSVTIAGERHALKEPFFVLATENPIEMEGTYPLPEAQLDRFLVKVIVPSPTEDELVQVLSRTTGQAGGAAEQVLDEADVIALLRVCRDIAVAEPVLRYATRLVRASDPTSANAPDKVKRGLRFGAGVRGAQSLVLAAKAVAMLEGRANVGFSDIQRVAPPCLRHRLIRSFEGEADGITTDDVVTALLADVPTRSPDVERAVRAG
jgi:MoxR-like ATPase